MESARLDEEVDELLSSLRDGLQSIETTMSELLKDMAADNAELMAELDTALANAEAVLASD